MKKDVMISRQVKNRVDGSFWVVYSAIRRRQLAETLQSQSFYTLARTWGEKSRPSVV